MTWINEPIKVEKLIVKEAKEKYSKLWQMILQTRPPANRGSDGGNYVEFT